MHAQPVNVEPVDVQPVDTQHVEAQAVETHAGDTEDKPFCWLEGDEIIAWRGLLQVTSRLLATLDDELAPQGLTLAEYEVLGQLIRAQDHRLRMTELAARSLVSRSGLTRRIDGLERRGLVRRETCRSDRRGANAVLTPEGEAVLHRAAPGHVRGVRRHYLDKLTPEQIAALAIVFATIEPDADLTSAGSRSESPAAGRTR